jgi:hypothetical protein
MKYFPSSFQPPLPNLAAPYILTYHKDKIHIGLWMGYPEIRHRILTTITVMSLVKMTGFVLQRL